MMSTNPSRSGSPRARGPVLLVSVPLLAAGLVGLAGCGGSSSTSPQHPAASVSYSDPAASQGAGAASDLIAKSCTVAKGGVWSFGGTIKNSSDKASTYTVTLSIVRSVGSTVVATKQVVKDVAAGATEKLPTAAVLTVAGSDKGHACVISTRAQRH